MALLAIRFQVKPSLIVAGVITANETVEAVSVALTGELITRQLFQVRAYPCAARLPRLVRIACLAYKVVFAHDVRVMIGARAATPGLAGSGWSCFHQRVRR